MKRSDNATNCFDLLAGVMDIVAVLLVVMTVAFLLWASHRGLDITDEGLYLLTTQDPGNVTVASTSFHWLTWVLYRITGRNLVWLRMLGVVIAVGAGLLLAQGARRLYNTLAPKPDEPQARRRVSEISLITLGTMLGYVWFLPTPSYNSVNGWAVTAGVGSLLMALARLGPNSPRQRSALGWMTVAGVCVGVSFFAKFPTAVCLLGLFSGVVLLWPYTTLRTRARACGAMVLGVFLVCTIYFSLLESPLVWGREFRAGLWFAANLGDTYNLGALPRYWQDWLDGVIRRMSRTIWCVAGILFVCAATLRFPRKEKRWRLMLSFATWTLLSYAGFRSFSYLMTKPLPFGPAAGTEAFAYQVVGFYFGWIALIGAAAFGGVIGSAWQTNLLTPDTLRAFLIAGLMLFLAAFAGAMGTGNTIYLNMVYSLGPWFVIFVWALRYLSQFREWRYAGSVASLGLSAFCVLHIVGGATMAPYRLNTGLMGQTVATEIGSPPSTVKLDPTTRDYLTSLQRMARENGFKPGDDLLAFFNMPGIVFALGGRSPGIPFYSGRPSARKVNEVALQGIGRERLSKAFLLQSTESDEWLKTLSWLGISFPDDYVLCGKLTVQESVRTMEVRLWRPVNPNGMPTK